MMSRQSAESAAGAFEFCLMGPLRRSLRQQSSSASNYPIAELLRKKACPFIFATGYGTATFTQGAKWGAHHIKTFRPARFGEGSDIGFGDEGQLNTGLPALRRLVIVGARLRLCRMLGHRPVSGLSFRTAHLAPRGTP